MHTNVNECAMMWITELILFFFPPFPLLMHSWNETSISAQQVRYISILFSLQISHTLWHSSITASTLLSSPKINMEHSWPRMSFYPYLSIYFLLWLIHKHNWIHLKNKTMWTYTRHIFPNAALKIVFMQDWNSRQESCSTGSLRFVCVCFVIPSLGLKLHKY